MSSDLTHFDAEGRARMVDVSDKDITTRIAVARGTIHMRPETLELILKGKVEKGDVTFSNPRMTLLEAMQLAADRDRIARAYVTAYADLFDLALPALQEAASIAETPELAITTLHMTLLAAFPDSHILRKWGSQIAGEVQVLFRVLTRD